jgi:hypothetical protein
LIAGRTCQAVGESQARRRALDSHPFGADQAGNTLDPEQTALLRIRARYAERIQPAIVGDRGRGRILTAEEHSPAVTRTSLRLPPLRKAA